jgi:hypothetical protein
VNRARAALPCVLLAGLFIVLLIGSVGHSLSAVFFAALALYPADLLLQRTGDERLLTGLNLVGAGPGWRFFYRQVLIVVFVLRSGELSGSAQALVVIAVIAHHGVHALYNGFRVLVSSGRLRRIETRNMPVPGESLPPPPPPWLLAGGGPLVLHTDVALTVALGWALATGSYSWVPSAAVVMVLAALALALSLLPQVLALHRLPSGETRLRAAQEAVLELKPVVILYFSGGVEAVYQVNMWLETMERLNRPVLVLLRERRYLDQFGPTTVPVLCMPFSVDLMNFEIPSGRVALYVSNVGRNLHLLRLPTLKSAFIGHGDSDKTASFNPFAKVYDEVWVAGEAGRQRYLRAQVGVREGEIVLVGRPQLDGILPAGPRPPGAPFTVLYAPTWEGWTDDPHQSSLMPMGRDIIRILIGTPGVRVLYKPHPLTGSVNPEASRASAEIVDMLAAAGSQHVAVLDATPLYDCFNNSDALISDISSVVSDYLRSEKPYFVTNGAAIPDRVFQDQNPSAGAAYLIGPHAARLVEGLESARGPDPLRARRAEVRDYLLGDPDADAMTLFRQAVDNLVAKSDAHQSVARFGVGDDDERLEQHTAPESLSVVAAREVGMEDG